VIVPWLQLRFCSRVFLSHKRNIGDSVPANFLKTLGYLISTVSVALLAIVAWSTLADDPGLRLALIVGVATSILGMVLRWLSYQVREKEVEEAVEKAAPPARTRLGA
jgi:ABC-type transport system involved in cytochrome bd biosynthesis fused ATPase/permease subunit